MHPDCDGYGALTLVQVGMANCSHWEQWVCVGAVLIATASLLLMLLQAAAGVINWLSAATSLLLID